MKNLLDFIFDRHALMYEMDEEIKKLRIPPHIMQTFIEDAPPHGISPNTKMNIQDCLAFITNFTSLFQTRLRLLESDFDKIPDSDFVLFLAHNELAKTLRINTPAGIEQYFDFSSFYAPAGRSDPVRCRRLVYYYLSFLLLKAPALISKLFNRMAPSKLLPQYRIHKSGVTIGPVFEFLISPPCVRITKTFEPQLEKCWVATALEGEGFVFCHEEILFFHELIHMVHLFTGRWLNQGDPLPAIEAMHIRRELSLEKQKRYAERLVQYNCIRDQFGNPIRNALFEEFHTILGGQTPPPIEKANLMSGTTLDSKLAGFHSQDLSYLRTLGLNENALRYELRLRLRESHFFWQFKEMNFKLLAY